MSLPWRKWCEMRKTPTWQQGRGRQSVEVPPAAVYPDPTAGKWNSQAQGQWHRVKGWQRGPELKCPSQRESWREGWMAARGPFRGGGLYCRQYQGTRDNVEGQQLAMTTWLIEPDSSYPRAKRGKQGQTTQNKSTYGHLTIDRSQKYPLEKRWHLMMLLVKLDGCYVECKYIQTCCPEQNQTPNGPNTSK